MNWCRFVVTAVLAAGLAAPAPAGIFFNRKPKADAAERVPVLVGQLKTGTDSQRADAADELQNYDPAVQADIVPALVEAALKDSSSSVRLQAVQTLGKLRPVTQQAGQALEQATHDSSLRVQLQARSLLVQYKLSGYSSTSPAGTAPNGKSIKTEEPPLAPPLDAEASPVAPAPSKPIGKRVPSTPTAPVVPTAAPSLTPTLKADEGPQLIFPN